MTDEPITQPYSPSAEEAIIGGILIDPDQLARVAISPDDFYIIKNRMIWEAILAVSGKSQQPDYITVCTELDARGQLKDIGGRDYISRLLTDCVNSQSVNSYIEIVKERARRRRILNACRLLTTSAFDLDSNIQDAVAQAMDALSKASMTARGSVHIREYLSQLYDQIEAAHQNPQEIYGIPTGFPDWDNIAFGLQAGEVVKLSGEPGVGKSLLAFEVVIHAAQAGHTCVVYSMEMGGLQLARRGLSRLSNVRTNAMRSGRMTEQEFEAIVKQFEVMSELPIFIADSSEMTTMDMRVDLQYRKEVNNVELSVIDYEALFTDGENALNGLDASILKSKRVHGIIRDTQVACISIGDMTKMGISGQQKGQAAVAGGAKTLHDADQIIVLRKDETNKNLITATWEKMREGDADRFFQLYRKDGIPAFESVKRPNAQQPSTRSRP